MMNVTVVFADNANTWHNTFEINDTLFKHDAILPRPTVTVAEAISLSGFNNFYKSDVPLATLRVGIWGAFVTMETAVHNGDRIEIYIPSKGTKEDLIQKKQNASVTTRKLPNK
jgi:putative ubiquitin-RnfH superfamily antitoxin RatB of RatAB toxin-antitoxin module